MSQNQKSGQNSILESQIITVTWVWHMKLPMVGWEVSFLHVCYPSFLICFFQTSVIKHIAWSTLRKQWCTKQAFISALRVYTCVERHNKINSYTVVQVLGRKRKPMRLSRSCEMRPDSRALCPEQLRFLNQTRKEPRFAWLNSRESPTTLSQTRRTLMSPQECKIARCTQNQIEMRPIALALAP